MGTEQTEYFFDLIMEIPVLFLIIVEKHVALNIFRDDQVAGDRGIGSAIKVIEVFLTEEVLMRI